MSLPPPSPAGYGESQSHVQEFANDLLDEAGKLADRYGAEQASPIHVREAASRLYRRQTSRRNQIIGSIGGLVAGTGASTLASLMITSEPNNIAIGVCALLSAVGTAAVMHGFSDR